MQKIKTLASLAMTLSGIAQAYIPSANKNVGSTENTFQNNPVLTTQNQALQNSLDSIRNLYSSDSKFREIYLRNPRQVLGLYGIPEATQREILKIGQGQLVNDQSSDPYRGPEEDRCTPFTCHSTSAALEKPQEDFDIASINPFAVAPTAIFDNQSPNNKSLRYIQANELMVMLQEK